MISLLLTLLVLILVFGLIGYALSLVPLPPPFHQVAYVVLAIILILVLVGYLGPLAGPHYPLLR